MPLFFTKFKLPVNFLIIILVLIYLPGALFSPLVKAESLDVSAQVLATMPVNAVPIFTSPLNNLDQSRSTVVVTGLCPVVIPALIVVFTRNGEFIGSTNCSEAGTFSIVLSLILGLNIIESRFMTKTGQFGGYGKTLTFTYVESGSVVNTVTIELSILSDRNFINFIPGAEFNLELKVKGGTSPYTLSVDWADGEVTSKVLEAAGSYNVAHNYKHSGKFTIKLRVVDKTGNSKNLFIAASSSSVAPPLSTSKNKPKNSYNKIYFFIVIAAALTAFIYYKFKMVKSTKKGPKLVKLKVKTKKVSRK